MMTAAEVGNHFTITQETKMDLDDLNITIIICYIQLTLTCLTSRTCAHFQNRIQESWAVSAGHWMFSGAKQYSDLNCCCNWDLL